MTALSVLGYPEAALADADRVLKDAREIGQAATLMYALAYGSMTHIHCGDYAAANAQLDELVGLAEEKGALLWKALAMVLRGRVLALTGKPSDAVQPAVKHGAFWKHQLIRFAVEFRT